MNLADVKRPVWDALIALSLASLSVWFLVHGFMSENGTQARIAYEMHAQELEQDRAALQAELAQLQNLTSRLSATRLDFDLLDERARDVLGLVRVDEVIIN